MLIKYISRTFVLLCLVFIGLVFIGLSLRAYTVDVPPPGKLYDVGSHKLHLDCRGEKNGQPTIVFESGATTPSPVYYHFAKNLSKTHKICLYDRAGLAWSEASGVPSEIPAITEQLHALLNAANIEKPFVLAGHSIAGLYMKSYIQKYPEEVAAIGFFDASHPDQFDKLGLPLGPDEGLSFEQHALRLLIKLGVTQIYNPQMGVIIKENFPAGVVAQFEHFHQSSTQVEAAFNEMKGIAASSHETPRDINYRSLPVLVITAGEEVNFPTSFPLSSEEFEEYWLELQADLVALSDQSTHIVMDSANHLSMFTSKSNADEVADYLRDLVRLTQVD
jgi:pimeloyl-ACP methyl ester carboxylesterase